MSKELHLYLFGKCPTIVIAGRGLWDGPGLNLLENLQEAVGGD